ncbi:hypothetical protein [Asticcacaulis sp. 201]|uniref:hypothetical protein n=1 Tax=Asticcacaulis sp. 201 TaxID=3028787 RepID=UPI002916A5EB|nr:hypothetical protein [Asticcacaulis sp. 201]MDV6333256.1 hypothetical protein [Asticcacaulis sp. 201]
MWSRRHFANAQPIGMFDFVLGGLDRANADHPVVENLSAIALPFRRRLTKLKPAPRSQPQS